MSAFTGKAARRWLEKTAEAVGSWAVGPVVVITSHEVHLWFSLEYIPICSRSAWAWLARPSPPFPSSKCVRGFCQAGFFIRSRSSLRRRRVGGSFSLRVKSATSSVRAERQSRWAAHRCYRRRRFQTNYHIDRETAANLVLKSRSLLSHPALTYPSESHALFNR